MCKHIFVVISMSGEESFLGGFGTALYILALCTSKKYSKT